jgi:FkbM family methyltransferase
MFKYFKYLDYYIEVFGKRLSGRGLSNPNNNGEFRTMESIVKNSKGSFCFIDGGSNVGEHILKLDSVCKDFGISNPLIFAVEPFPLTIGVLKKNISHISYKLIDKALGKEESVIKFYSESDTVSGQNSAIQHYYLNSAIEVEQTTIDDIVKEYDLQKIDFLKLDIEGYEYNALLGAQKTLSDGLINYIQLEYCQTWIDGGGTIKKVLDLANAHSYKLYRIRKNDLFSIPSYDFNIEDFYFCNLLLVKNGCDLPMPSNRKAIPII